VKTRLLLLAFVFVFASCARRDSDTVVKVSVPNQKLIVFKRGVEVAKFDCSTSKYGVGDAPGSYRTPLGRMVVAQKIGDGLPSGMKLKSRRPTGEIVKPNSPGRDPIVSRILWLRGTERQNSHAYSRTIYIHGTAEEATIGTPASYGCIRMRSRDVIRLYDTVGVGAIVDVSPHPFPAPLVRDPAPTPAPSAAEAPVVAAPVATPNQRAATTSEAPKHRS
jgi:lipoprotein-anchoring transpeptidase ErfK/SrfK